MKQLTSIVGLVMLVALIAGCGQSNTTTQNTEPANDTAAANVQNDTQEPTEVEEENKEAEGEEHNDVVIEEGATIEEGVVIEGESDTQEKREVENTNTSPKQPEATTQNNTPPMETPQPATSVVKSSLPITSHTIGWKGNKKVGAKHFGSIALKSGTLMFENDTLVGGDFTINMQSINVQDLSGGSKNSLENHLKSDDFFATATHPEARLVITNAQKKNDTTYTVTAILTLKNITHPVTFTTTLSGSAGAYTAQANFSIDRSLWDVRFGSGKFFTDLGNKLIEDQIPLSISLTT